MASESIIEAIQPRDEAHWHELRLGVVTSTEASALLNQNPYVTAFELWHRKRNREIVQIDNERVRMGKRLQSAIAEEIAERQGWKIRPMTEFMRDPRVRLGASFDYFIDGLGPLEIKNVDALEFKKKWITHEDGAIEGPIHIEAQLQVQIALTQRPVGYLGVLIGGNELKVIERQLDSDAIGHIRSKTVRFWDSIVEGVAPAPIFPDDSEAVIALHNASVKGKVLDARVRDSLTELVANYRGASEALRQLEAQKNELKARILIEIGDHEKVVGSGYSISAGAISVKEKIVKPYSYRGFRVTWRNDE